MIAVASGSTCVPLNPGFTADEWRRYLPDLRISALLVHPDANSACSGVAQALGIPVIDLMPRPSEGLGAFSLMGRATDRTLDQALSGSTDDAFILMTSGTSSRPKTVPLTHEAVCRSAYNVGATLALGSRDRLLSVLPLFHVHGLASGLIAALSAGASVVCTNGFDAGLFFKWLKEFRPTWYTAVPAIHRAVLSAAGGVNGRINNSSLRVIRSASSTLPPDLTSRLESLFGVPVIDTYGMTEAASQIAANPMGRRKPGSVGTPAGAEIAIMDLEGRPLAAGKQGEIVLRGPTITRGYDNDSTATATSFRDGWFRTGDLGYFDSDGYLFIVGRIKEIINRGGQKIAPSEVEQALLRHPDVVEAVAFSVPHKRLGEDVGAAVVLRPDAEARPHELRQFARECLARFKVPSLIRIVPEIPKGAAGKVKRSELAATLSISRPDAAPKTAAPGSELERQLVATWGELLDLQGIGVEEDVFALGADSITVTRMLSRLRARFSVDLSFQDIFEAPTVAALAARLKSWQSDPAAVYAGLCGPMTDSGGAEPHGPKPVSFVQEQALRIDRELVGLPDYTTSFRYRLRGPLNIQALERSLGQVVRRHDSLRTGFSWIDERPVALVLSAVDAPSFFAIEDLAAPPQSKSRWAKRLLLKKAELKVEREILTAFDLTRAPLIRARVFRLAADDHVLVLILHDLIVDGWSIGILMAEVSQLYTALAAGQQAQLPEPAMQFSDFARWQRRWSASAPADRQLADWKERLRDVAPLFATNDLEGALLDARVAEEPVRIPKNLVTRLSALSQSQGATLFMTLLAGFKTLLLARTGRNDICIATPMANRSHLVSERVIGPVANTTLIRTRLDPDLSFRIALSRVRDSVLESYVRQELPFGILAARLAQDTGVDPASLVQVIFVLQNAFRRELQLADVVVEPLAFGRGDRTMSLDPAWLRVTLREYSRGISGTCNYREDVFEAKKVRQGIADYKTILARAAVNPDAVLRRLASPND